MLLSPEMIIFGKVMFVRCDIPDKLIFSSGDKRGHGKTPLFMAGMKCLPLCKVTLLSAANNYVESQNEPRVKK